MRTWASLANERAQLLLAETERLDRNGAGAGLGHAKEELQKISDALNPDDPQKRAEEASWIRGLQDWWTGARAEDAWLQLHLIEEEIEDFNKVEEVILHARKHVETDADANKKLTEQLHDLADTESKRSVAIHAIRSSHERSHQKHIDERQRLRAMAMFAGGLTLAAVATFVLQVAKYDAHPFLVLPKDATGATVGIGAGSLVLVVMLFGAIGGAFSGLTSLYLTAKAVNDTMWFDPRPMLAITKVVMGLWTGFFGVLMVGTGLVVGVYTSVPSAIILAFLFGYGQQAVTGVLLDRHVGKLTEEPSK